MSSREEGNMNPSTFLPLMCLLLWCLLSFHFTSTGGCLAAERAALLALKAGMNASLPALSSWDRRTEEDCCKWAGVVCHSTTGRVLKLKLRNPADPEGALSGDDDDDMRVREINSSLLALTELRYLDLSFNDFHGAPFPDFVGSFTKLKYLDLSFTNFAGGIPPRLGNLSSLRYLDLAGALDADVMAVDNLGWLSSLASLKHLDLSLLDLSNVDHWSLPASLQGSLNSLRMAGCMINGLPVLQENAVSSAVYSNFTSLDILDLSGNQFNTTLPQWLWSISSLTHLDLGYCGFQGTVPDAIGYLKSLTYLSLEFNQNLKGVIPSSLANLSRLEELNLHGNQLTGSFPDWVLQLTSLTVLDLHENQLHGSIPTGIGKLSNLTSLLLSTNFFGGVISEVHLQNLTRLQELDLSANSLRVLINHNWLPPFQLELLGLGSCHLGPRIPRWLQHQATIYGLDLSDNEIEGTLPDWVWNISSSTIEYLELSDNRIQGKLPVLPEGTNLQMLRLGNNLLEGPLPTKLPAKLATLVLFHNVISGQLPLWPHLLEFSISNNNLDGAFPASICQWRMLTVLYLSNNNLSGNIPHCLGESLPDLDVLDLENNNLSGEIPATVGFLKSLGRLNLKNNNLSGELPLSLLHCASLISLNLAHNNFVGSIPRRIGESLTSLAFLHLNSNNFSGDIPWQLAQLEGLQVLELSDNMLTGSIPQNFGNFSSMASTSQRRNDVLRYIQLDVSMKGQELEYLYTSDLVKSLDLSSNNLTGEIPSGLGGLAGLKNLNLSRNHLTGVIPPQIGGMASLESLDLSMNGLRGSIPENLSILTFLSYLNLSYNNLNGKIPFVHQLQALDDPSIYVGNPELCGPPLSRDCPKNKTMQVTEEQGRKSFEWLWLCISMILGFMMGFWTFCAVLIFKTAWRYSYFRMLDDLCDRMLLQWQLFLFRSCGRQ